MTNKSIRAAQLISPFGPGAVVDLGSESFTCVDISRWPAGECPALQDNPLQRALGKTIRTPPRDGQMGEVPVSRFPRWLFCPTCRRLYNYNTKTDSSNAFRQPCCENPECSNASLVPMRFIAVCEEGHMQDVDWFFWAHRNAQISATGQCTRQTAKLFYLTEGASGGDFNAMLIQCQCGAKNTLEGLTNRPYPFSCLGKQPWEVYQTNRCQATPRVFPRAASNVYYAQTRSALDISYSNEEETGRLGVFKNWLVDYPGLSALRSIATVIPDLESKPEFYDHIVREGVREFGLREDEVRSAVITALKVKTPRDRQSEGDFEPDHSQHGFIKAEWPHLSGNKAIISKYLHTRPISLKTLWPAAFGNIFEQVTLIERLREIRALIGFKRMKPDEGSTLVPIDLASGEDWLPGLETFGEGILLKICEERVAAWEASVSLLVENRTLRLREACERWGRSPSANYSSPRFIALHTLAHGLLRRLAFDAGYSSTSIRERIYCDHGQSGAAGILLYTADGDSEGSLGGLVRQGTPERFIGTVKRTISDLSWCSGDPVCSETEAQGVDGMNSAACHACALVSETSCMYNNSLLDRRLVVGSPDGRIPGLLGDLILEAF